MLTSVIDPEIIRVIFSPLDFAEILGERKAGVWTEQTRFFPIVEATGEVTSYDDYATGGRAGAKLAELTMFDPPSDAQDGASLHASTPVRHSSTIVYRQHVRDQEMHLKEGGAARVPG